MGEEKKDGWLKRIKSVLDWARLLQWMWTLFPASWKAPLIATAIGAIGFVLALLRQSNLVRAWLYFISAIAIYGFGWLCVQIARWIQERGPTGTIKLTGYELHRSPEPQGLNSIFLRTKIELSGTRRAMVAGIVWKCRV